MFENIETQAETETITRHKLIIVLNEDEATAALVNPAPLLKRIRSERAKWHAAPAWSATGHADRRRRKQVKAGRRSAEKKSGKESQRSRQAVKSLNAMNLVPCPRCGEKFKARGLNKHLNSCPGADPLANLPQDE